MVLPAFGPLESDRTALGTGVLLSSRFFDAVVGSAEVADSLGGSSPSNFGVVPAVAVRQLTMKGLRPDNTDMPYG